LVDDEARADDLRSRDFGPRTMIGTPEQLTEIVAAYRDAGADELIVPDFTLGTGQQRLETLDRFMSEIASNFPRDTPADGT
jgi:alkanesulfonate monooxygenase SsuD/methylene tetrahydromethanopterin reductase-like flavin-dependent oxidoreductase (luciferase family)